MRFRFFFSILFTIQSICCLQGECRSSSSSSGISRQEADYVIVGVGTAGAVLARKLTDDKKTSVIALQNGSNLTADPEIKFSKNAIFTVLSALVGPPLYENGLTIPQLSDNDRELLWAIGKTLGGTSSVNAGAYSRSTNALYAQWEAVAGKNWSLKRIIKVFKELENYHGETSKPALRGYHGLLDIRQVQHPSEVAKKFAEAVHQATNIPLILDYNVTAIGSASRMQYTQKGTNGRLRESSAVAFLNKKVMTPEGQGVNGRKLNVLFNSSALRTIWRGKKAVGVQYMLGGEVKEVYAKKGVIVCAGLRSSAFLMHSGVGPSDLLSSLDIPIVYENANVGQGLADQTLLVNVFTSNPKDTPEDNLNSLFASIAFLQAPGAQSGRAVRFTTANLVPGFTLALLDLAPTKSRGRIRINSADPLAPPVVDIGIFSNPEDLNLYVQAMQHYLKAINETIHAMDKEYALVFPSPAILDDANLVEQHVKAFVMSNQCYESHCKMAALNNGGVVDDTGHVHGVENLIVADCSIAPVATDGTPMADAYLIASNIADLLLGK